MRVPLAIAFVALASRGASGANEEAYARALPLPDRLAALDKTAAEAAASGDREREAELLVEGCLSATLLTFDRRHPACARAEKAASGLASTVLLGRLRGYMSTILAWSLDWEGALALAAEAERLSPVDDPRAAPGRIYAMLVRGAVASEAGRFADVERELAGSLELSHRTRDRTGIANAEVYLCRFRRRIGHFSEAAPACDRSLTVARDTADPVLIAAALWNRGALESDRGDRTLAAATWGEALAVAERGMVPFLAITVRMELAQLLIELGRLDEAAHHVGVFEAAQQKGQVPPAFAFQLHLVAGSMSAARGELRGAAASFVAAQASPIDGIATQALVGEAEVRHRLGELAVAEERYRSAIKRIEAARTGVMRDEQRAVFLQRRVHAYKELVAVLWDRRGGEAAADALAVAESGRARALLDALAIARGEASGAATAANLPEVQKALPPGATLLLYVASERRLFGLAVTRERVAMAPLPGAGTRRDLEARVELFRRLLVTGADAAELADTGAALYRDIVAPVLGRAPGGTLVIAADGPLHLLPFEALSHRPGAYLVEEVDVVMTPSATLLARAAPPASRSSVLVAAGPPLPPPLPALTSAAAEVDAIHAEVVGATVLFGADASEQRLRAAASGAGIVHVATHAVIDDIVPQASGLALAPGAGGSDDDGWLRAEEVYRMRLANALVVLSSCRTGAGRVSASEGPMGLSRAFLHAGAHTVIATLWDVEDREGPPLTRALYRELALGLPIGAALSNAKRAAIRGGAPARAWAAWIAIGPATVTVALVPVPEPTDRRPTIVLALALVGAAALLAAVVLGRWVR